MLSAVQSKTFWCGINLMISFLFIFQPETIPQGIIDMNKCSAVNDGEKVTSHPFSLEIVTPSKKYYIKGQSKEEYQW
jgi:hypothetical protein